MNANRRLTAFGLGLLAAAGGSEAFVRGREAAFKAATHRALAKAALLDRQGPVDVLFLGTSRTQDGVSPRLFSAELAALGRGSVAAFNLAFTSSNLDSLEALAARYRQRPGLRLLVLELSVPQLENGPEVWQEAAEADDREGRLTAWVHDHVRLIANRSAWTSDNVVRLPSLLWFADGLDGSETRVADQLAAFVGRHESLPQGFDPTVWEPARWSGEEPEPGVAVPEAAARLAALVALNQAQGVQTVFVVPPLTTRFDAAERGPELKALFRELARRSGARVLDYSSLSLPDGLFRGDSHLNHEGRAQFSCALAREVGGLLGAVR